MLVKRSLLGFYLVLSFFFPGLFSSVAATPDHTFQLQESSSHVLRSDPPTVQAAAPGFMSSLMLPFSSAMKVFKLSKVRYNRVEGFFLGVGPPELKKADFQLFGYIGYGFEK